MKRNRFELLQQIRRRRLDACRLQLVGVGQCERVLRSRLDEMACGVRLTFAEQRQAVEAGGVDVGGVVECRRRRAELQGACDMLSRQSGLVREVLELARTNLEAAVREVDVIEKLVERAAV